ncbi:MAG: hypothetical protein ACOYLC_02635 [Armatimonadaceae bacterium]
MLLNTRGLIAGIAIVGAVAVCQPASAQNKPLPTGPVVVFPAVVDGAGDSAKSVSAAVVEALRSRLKGIGASVVVYSGKLPSMLRAREEQMFSKEVVDNGPADDRDAAKKMSVNIGATEFVQVFVDGYKFDAGSRTASFNLNVNRYLSSTGAPVGTVNFKQQGIAAAGTATKLQEAEAVSRAMTVGAEQSVGGLYPASTIVENAKPAKTNKKKGNNWIKPAFILGLLGLYSSTR